MARFGYVLKIYQSRFAERLKVGFREKRVRADRATRRIKIAIFYDKENHGRSG